MSKKQTQKPHPKSQPQEQLPSPDYSFRITIITLLAYGFGVIAYIDMYIAAPLLAIVCAVVMVNDKLKLFVQTPIVLLSFVATTFVFGLVHAYAYSQLTTFINLPPSQPTVWPLLQIYLSFMVVYYYFEFQLNNCFHHDELNWKSFLIYHSKPYMIAHTFCLCEHFVTKYVFQFEYKNSHYLIYPSLVMMTLGEGLRIAAFFTCKSNFTHLLRYKKHPTHQLITHGVYSFFRHPSYTGYFYFSVSCQLLLGNWISAVAFFFVLIRFFTERIDDEEHMLAKFFEKYIYYKKKTHIFIPFVKSPDSQDLLRQLIRRPNSVFDQSDWK